MTNNNWQGIHNQVIVKNILSRIIDSKRIPHAFLFYGPEGVGKDFTAVRFAQRVNLVSGDDETNLQSKIQLLSEPYIKFIFPLPRGKNEIDGDGPLEKLSAAEIEKVREEVEKRICNPYHRIKIPKANFIKISSIREINKFISFSFSDIKFRIILISDAHLMNDAAQNALLKNLEEPPEGVIFVLTTHLPGLLRETIRSRCWSLHFQPLSNDDVSKILIEHFNVDQKTAQTLAPFSGGSIASAVSLLEQNFDTLLDKTIHILRYSFGRKYHSALEVLSSFSSDISTETLQLIILMITTWFNDLQRSRIDSSETFYKDYPETFQKFNVKYPDLNLVDIGIKLDQLSNSLKGNANISTVILSLITQLSSLTINFKS